MLKFSWKCWFLKSPRLTTSNVSHTAQAARIVNSWFLRQPQFLLSLCQPYSGTTAIAAEVELHRRRLQQWFLEPDSGSGLEEPVLTESWRDEGGKLAAEEDVSGRFLSLAELFPKAEETVVVYGGVGSGKKTLVRRLLMDWSRRRGGGAEAGGLDRFGLVLPFSCQDLASARPVSLNRLIGLKFGHLRGVAPGLWDGSLGPVLLLFSDLEQFHPPGLNFCLSRIPLCADPDEPLTPSALVVNLLRKRLAPEASLLLTARPSALAYLPARYVQRLARLRGFPEAGQRLTYFRRRLEPSPEAAVWLEAGGLGLSEELSRKLERQSGLATACLVPSYCWLTSVTLHLLRFSPAQTQAPPAASPKTLTALYTRFLQLSFGGEVVPAARCVARTVGRLAHQGIDRGQSHFSWDQVNGCFQPEPEASEEERRRLAAFRDDTIGFFFTFTPATAAGPSGVEDEKPGTGLDGEPGCCFATPGLQEYLAALYVVSGERKSAVQRVGLAAMELLVRVGEELSAVLSVVSKLLPFRALALLNLFNVFPRLLRLFGFSSFTETGVGINSQTGVSTGVFGGSGAIANHMVYQLLRGVDNHNEDVLEQLEAGILGWEPRETEGVREAGARERTPGEREAWTAVRRAAQPPSFELFPIFMAGLLSRPNRLVLEEMGCPIEAGAVLAIHRGLRKRLTGRGGRRRSLPPSELMDLLLFLHELQDRSVSAQILGGLSTPGLGLSLSFSRVRMTALKCWVLARVLTPAVAAPPAAIAIHHLDLSRCRLGAPGLTALKPVLLRSRSLNLECNQIGPAAWDSVKEILLHPECGINTLRLCDNPMSEAAVRCLGAAIAGNRSLSHLSVARTSLGDAGMKVLAGYLESNTHLKELNLAYNQLSDQAAFQLMEVAKKHATLERVHLYFNELSDSGKAGLRGMRLGRDGVQVMVSVTEGLDVSTYWAQSVANVECSPASNRQFITERLVLFQKDLSEGRLQTWNPWKKIKFLRVETGIRRLLKKIKHGA